MVSKKENIKLNILGDFPGGPGVKDPPSNSEDAGLISGLGTKIPQAEGQLSRHITTPEPLHHKLQSLCALEPICHKQGEGHTS